MVHVKVNGTDKVVSVGGFSLNSNYIVTDISSSLDLGTKSWSIINSTFSPSKRVLPAMITTEDESSVLLHSGYVNTCGTPQQESFMYVNGTLKYWNITTVQN